MGEAELRAAAVRLRDGDGWYDAYGCTAEGLTEAAVRDIRAVADAFLVGPPESDSEPVDDAWARAVAPSGTVGNGRVTITIRPWALRINALTVSDRPTRGQVRRLAALFHVELNEPEETRP